jgi:hypothetical protein
MAGRNDYMQIHRRLKETLENTFQSAQKSSSSARQRSASALRGEEFLPLLGDHNSEKKQKNKYGEASSARKYSAKEGSGFLPDIFTDQVATLASRAEQNSRSLISDPKKERGSIINKPPQQQGLAVKALESKVTKKPGPLSSFRGAKNKFGNAQGKHGDAQPIVPESMASKLTITIAAPEFTVSKPAVIKDPKKLPAQVIASAQSITENKERTISMALKKIEKHFQWSSAHITKANSTPLLNSWDYATPRRPLNPEAQVISALDLHNRLAALALENNNDNSDNESDEPHHPLTPRARKA